MGWLGIGVMNEPYGVSFWKNIKSGWENFSRFIKFEVGNGLCIRFWHDPCCRDVILKEAFLELFHITRDRGLCDYMRWKEGIIHWDITFIRSVHDWELESLHSFLDLIKTPFF